MFQVVFTVKYKAEEIRTGHDKMIHDQKMAEKSPTLK